MPRDMDRRREWDRKRKRRKRVMMAAQRSRDAEAWYRAQAEDPTDPPPGVSPEQHRAWCAFVLALPKLDDLLK